MFSDFSDNLVSCGCGPAGVCADIPACINNLNLSCVSEYKYPIHS